MEDAVHLLGVTHEWLIAGGRKLYWISLREEDRGRVKHVWPDGAERPGYGRGLLAGQERLVAHARQAVHLRFSFRPSRERSSTSRPAAPPAATCWWPTGDC